MERIPGVGSTLGQYRLTELLGHGGMGVVYRAEDLRLERNVALKLLSGDVSDDARFRTRFLRESRLAASTEHPGIVPIYAAGEIDGLLYIAMRYARDPTSRGSCARRAPWTPGAPSTLSPSSPTRSTPRTRAGSCTGTSSRATR